MSEEKDRFWTQYKKFASTEVLMYLTMVLGIGIGILILI